MLVSVTLVSQRLWRHSAAKATAVSFGCGLGRAASLSLCGLWKSQSQLQPHDMMRAYTGLPGFTKERFR